MGVTAGSHGRVACAIGPIPPGRASEGNTLDLGPGVIVELAHTYHGLSVKIHHHAAVPVSPVPHDLARMIEDVLFESLGFRRRLFEHDQ